MAEERSDRRPTHWHDRIRWVLLIITLALVATLLMTGVRTAAYGEFIEAVESGRVDEVTVSAVPAGADLAIQHVYWSEGNRTRTLIVGVDPDLDTSGMPTPDVAAMVESDMEDLLADTAPHVTVTTIGEVPSTIEVAKRHVPSWYGGMFGVILLITVAMLILGPQPWWATKWAWFWLVSNPVTLIAYFALSGPTPGVPVPNPDRGRLTGGWAFLLSILLGAIVGGFN